MTSSVIVRSSAPGRMPMQPAPAYAATLAAAAVSNSWRGMTSTMPSGETMVGSGKRWLVSTSRVGRPMSARSSSVRSTRIGAQLPTG